MLLLSFLFYLSPLTLLPTPVCQGPPDSLLSRTRPMTTFSVSTTSRYLWVNAASDFKSDHPWKSAHPLPGYARCMGAHVEALTHFCWVFPVLAWDLCGSQNSIPSVTSSTMEPSLRFQRLTSPSRVCCLQHSAPDERTLISEAQLDPSVCLSVSRLC